MNGIFIFLRNPLLYRLLGRRTELRLQMLLKADPQNGIRILLMEFICSNNPGYKLILLSAFLGLPKATLESHADLKKYFICEMLRSNSVEEGINTCISAAVLLGVRRRKYL